MIFELQASSHAHTNEAEAANDHSDPFGRVHEGGTALGISAALVQPAEMANGWTLSGSAENDLKFCRRVGRTIYLTRRYLMHFPLGNSVNPIEYPYPRPLRGPQPHYSMGIRRRSELVGRSGQKHPTPRVASYWKLPPFSLTQTQSATKAALNHPATFASLAGSPPRAIRQVGNRLPTTRWTKHSLDSLLALFSFSYS